MLSEVTITSLLIFLCYIIEHIFLPKVLWIFDCWDGRMKLSLTPISMCNHSSRYGIRKTYIFISRSGKIVVCLLFKVILKTSFVSNDFNCSIPLPQWTIFYMIHIIIAFFYKNVTVNRICLAILFTKIMNNISLYIGL